MSLGSALFEFLYKILSHTMVVHVYSTPNFAMETFISVLMCMVHVLLLIEIEAMMRNVQMPPIKVRLREATPVVSRCSVNKSVVRSHPELGVDILFKENRTYVKSEWDTVGKINKILSRTLSEYIRRDLKKISSNIIAEEPGGEELSSTPPPSCDEFKSSTKMASIDKIYDLLVPEPEVQRRISKNNATPDKELIRLH